MSKGTCSIASCTRPRRKREWCDTHYARWRHHGHTDLLPVRRTPAGVRIRRQCSVNGCDRVHESKGYCNVHYRRFRQYGDPHGRFDFKAQSVEVFWSKVEKTDTCWLWRGNLNEKGYGKSTNTRLFNAMAHRAVYIFVKGEIPIDPETGKSLELDHLCRVRHCVNPDHLEPVTHTENIHRGSRYGGRVTCKRGHLRSEHTVVNINGHRFCRECARENDLKRRPPQSKRAG